MKIPRLFIVWLVVVITISLINIKPTQAAGASLYLYPNTGTFVVGSTFKVSIKVNSGGQNINAAEGSIHFDTDKLSVVSVSKGGSIFNLWTTEPKASGGSISFGGGIPQPGYTGSAGHIITITFKAKKVGTAQVSFTSGAVLANDGKGTNILASMGSGSYTISPKVEAPKSSTKTIIKEERGSKIDQNRLKPNITSPTHPDQQAWYKERNVKFEWELPEGVTGVSLAFNHDPEADPGPISDGLFSSKEYKDVEDGVWYFHLKFKDKLGWGAIAHYRVQIDNSPPLPFKIEYKQENKGDWPVLFFKTDDEVSGILKYEIIIGSLEEKGYEANPDNPSLKVSDLEVGKHVALIKAIDKAGNVTVSTGEFVIDPIEAPVITDYPRELKSSDKFFISGTAVSNATINVYIQKDNKILKKTTESDKNGNWFLINDAHLENGRYVAWAEAINSNGLKSNFSKKISFLVTPPIFARIGSFVINYFTVFVSLLFMIILIVILLVYLVGIVRRRLKKETIEVEKVLHNNLVSLKKAIEQEINNLSKLKDEKEYKSEQTKAKKRLKKKIEMTEKKILKEIKDVENILK